MTFAVSTKRVDWRGTPNQEGEHWLKEDLANPFGVWSRGASRFDLDCEDDSLIDRSQDLEELLARKRGEIQEPPEEAPVVEGDPLLTYLRGQLVELDRVILLCRDQGLSQDEITRLIGYRQPTISDRLARVREWSDRVSTYLRPAWEAWGLAGLPDLKEGPEIPEEVSGFDRMVLQRVVWQMRKPAHLALEAAPFHSGGKNVLNSKIRNHLLPDRRKSTKTLMEGSIAGSPWQDLLAAWRNHQRENPGISWGAPGLVSTRSSGCVPRPNPGWEHLLTGL
jgi:hypothetical protein